MQINTSFCSLCVRLLFQCFFSNLDALKNGSMTYICTYNAGVKHVSNVNRFDLVIVWT